MSTNRELFFRYQKEGIPNSVIFFALEQVNGFTHTQLAMNFDLKTKNYATFCRAMERYLKGEMIEYVFNKSYFLNRPFYIDKHVLIPRQETEQLVVLSLEKIKQKFGDKKLKVADICTGSGAIGISVALAQTDYIIYLSDIDHKAIKVADKNIEFFGLTQAHTFVGDMLRPLIEREIKVDVIICNPPYIDDPSTIDSKTWKEEPHLALLASPFTKFYEMIFQDMNRVLNDKYLLCFEIGEEMELPLTALLKQCCIEANYTFEKDLYGKTRFLFVESKN